MVIGTFRAMHPHWTIPVLKAGAVLDQETRWCVPGRVSKMVMLDLAQTPNFLESQHTFVK